MATVDYGQGEKEIIVSVKSLMLYEQEFGGRDMIKDVYGRVSVRKSDVKALEKLDAANKVEEAEEFVETGDSDEILMELDYRNTNWTALIRALWACLKTADDSLPPFKEWEQGVGDIDLFAVSNQIVPELNRKFFRAGVSAS